MKKTTFLLLFLSFAFSDFASANIIDRENTLAEPNSSAAYLEHSITTGGWGSNWFIQALGGGNAFVGQPVGCGDFFDKLKPMAGFAVGKWIVPAVGLRISAQGFKFLDSNLNSNQFQNIHADVMYNFASHLQHGIENPKWKMAVFVGSGLIRNHEGNNRLFGLSYGLQAQYSITKRLSLTAELAATSTFQNFDYIAKSEHLDWGDRLFQGSIGLSLAVGNVGWKKVTDAKPYIYDNDMLKTQLREAENSNLLLTRKLNAKNDIIEQLKKILEIEGLLSKYTIADDSVQHTKPFNNYRGLNSLKARIMKKQLGEENVQNTPAEDGSNNTIKQEVGAPVFIFFQINSVEMTETSQLVNIDALAQVMTKYNLSAVIKGAADAQTGSEAGNLQLSLVRAAYISKLLEDRGVNKAQITIEGQGGIDTYNPIQANRHTSIQLFLQ